MLMPRQGKQPRHMQQGPHCSGSEGMGARTSTAVASVALAEAGAQAEMVHLEKSAEGLAADCAAAASPPDGPAWSWGGPGTGRRWGPEGDPPGKRQGV
eukprot:CAMPEP_0174336826 /NCGR_PEP_ID=MMETSP0810-20121108/21835_1 /TAXON_ID=73025 ORGANISM="Eutreptiella gymnastica-like, Strain CCMP1594" /NCGR_SAMPLE_ID=MMETSP0810 /ASSEMBLY_ACC=CAM_ASM_000659 /LENGTH=97 /DNA_ID=CAMNT_0015455921 /DNA_START=205 /DNA_END=500 /DNA_ORIENTATION=+